MGRHRCRGRSNESGCDGRPLGNMLRHRRPQADHHQRSHLHHGAVHISGHVDLAVDGARGACSDRIDER